MTKKVSPSDIRLAVEWLAANANGVSPIDWEPRSQTLLNAADEIDRLNKKCAALAFLLYGKPGEIERLQAELVGARNQLRVMAALTDAKSTNNAVEPNPQPSALERAFSENAPIVESALRKIGAQLGDDLMIFGSAFAKRNADGSIVRVDPKDVYIRSPEKS